ncbi:phage major capsid protein [Nitratireductor aquibiodomus]|uniref:phage major capsid protein n=1 Tax=Nitratireductor aquibiodomus TaxID=204799 RepID=UPI0019D3EBEB|nr:phage major capsid protein [Nitratireductor aquibiodomus]MBN7763647.1 phage major capsid protein [Nitratireductor aquibiodomus]
MSELASMITNLGDKFKATTEDLTTRLNSLERRAARETEPANDNHKSLGHIVANDEAVRNLTSEFRGKAVVKLRGENAAITSYPATVGSNTSAGTSLVPAHRVPGIVTPYQRRMTIRDLLRTARTTSNNIEWPVETNYTNNADVVSEGAKKPYSDLTFELQNAPVRTIAHMFKASRQILDDADALASYIDRRGRYGLQFKEELQLLRGDGTGQNVEGIIPQARAYETARNSTGDTPLDVLNHAISQAEESDIPITGIVLSKKMWRDMLGIKDGDERYLSGGPFGTTAAQIWDLPAIGSNAMADGEFLVGAFQDGATIFDRLEAEVLVSSENDDDFERNLFSIRAEERLALAVFRPDAFVTGQF